MTVYRTLLSIRMFDIGSCNPLTRVASLGWWGEERGVGILIISQLLHNSLRTFGWRLGLQALTVLITATFFLGMFYRHRALTTIYV